jgi:SAM-dependent methyltransferase
LIDPRETFGPVAQHYLESPIHGNEAALAHMVRVAKPAGGPIVDIATGAGHTALAFAPHAEHIFATDITKSMLEIVRRTVTERGLTNVSVQLGAAESLPFEAETMEGVTCRLAAHHFVDISAFLSESWRILRPNGWLFVVDLAGVADPQASVQWDEIERLRDPSHRRNLQPDEWRMAIERQGFVIEFDEIVPKPMNLEHWLDRMRVHEPVRSRIREAIIHSEGWLRDHLRPHGEGADAIFHEHEISILARKK